MTTAVATCGTAFGEDHTRILRRLLLDHDEFRGEVIFTFDGDEAGQKAALRAFEGDQQFVGQTYVAVEPDGRDPCDLRLAEGDAAVRELIARRVPLYRFVLGNVVSRYDLDRADSRVDAMREAAKLVASVRDRSKVEAFARELAGMVGVDVDDVRAEVRRAGTRRGPKPHDSPAARAATRTAPAARTRRGRARPARATLHDRARRAQAGAAASGRDRRADRGPDLETRGLHPPVLPSDLRGDRAQLGGPAAARPEAVADDGRRCPPSPAWCRRLPVEPLPCHGEPDEKVASRRTSCGCAS